MTCTDRTNTLQQDALLTAMHSAGIDELTPVDSFIRMQNAGFPCIYADYTNQHDLDDMLDRAEAGESLWRCSDE